LQLKCLKVQRNNTVCNENFIEKEIYESTHIGYLASCNLHLKNVKETLFMGSQLPRFHVSFWLSQILVYYFNYVLAFVQARTEIL